MSEPSREAWEAICNEIAKGGDRRSEDIIDEAFAAVLRPPHRCVRIATAIMDQDRDWWIGRLLEPIAEWPQETHCLHMKTPIKDVTFLCNCGDFEQLMTLSNVVVQLQNLDWLKSMTTGAELRLKGNEDDD